MIAIGLAVDTGRPVVLAIVIPIAVAVLAALTGAMIFGAYRRARVRSSELLGARGAASIRRVRLARRRSDPRLRFRAARRRVVEARHDRDRNRRRRAGHRRAGSRPLAAPDDAGQPSLGRPVSRARFNELIHASTRLAIVSLLAAAEWADFKFIRDEVGLSDSALSKQLTTLEEAGYVEIRKAFIGKRPRTSVGSARPDVQRLRCMWRRCSRSSTGQVPPVR